MDFNQPFARLRFMDALAEAAEAGEESISAGVRRLVAAGEMGAAPFAPGRAG